MRCGSSRAKPRSGSCASTTRPTSRPSASRGPYAANDDRELMFVDSAPRKPSVLLFLLLAVRRAGASPGAAIAARVLVAELVVLLDLLPREAGHLSGLGAAEQPLRFLVDRVGAVDVE